MALASVQRIEQKIRSRQTSEDKCQALARHGHRAQVVKEMKQTWQALPMESPEFRMKYQNRTVRRHCGDCKAEGLEEKRGGGLGHQFTAEGGEEAEQP